MGFFNNIFFKEATTNKELPQGCILSPLLFNLYISQIYFHVPKEVRILGFTDDLIIYFRDESVENIREKLNES